MKKEISARTKAEQSTIDEVTTSSHTISKPNVGCWFCRLFKSKSIKKKSEDDFNKEDAYDVENAFLLESGVYSVAEYYYIKGRTIGFQVASELRRDTS